MTSTAGIDAVPYAIAAIACAPPTRYTVSTPSDHRRREHDVGHGARTVWRHTDDDLADTRDTRGHRGHEDGGRVDRETTGHVAPGAVDGATQGAHHKPVALVADIGRGLGGGEVADVGGRQLERPTQRRRNALERSLAVGFRDREVVDVDSVESFRELADRVVAARSDIRQDRPYGLDHLGRARHRRPRQGRLEVGHPPEVEPREHPATVLSAASRPRRGNAQRMNSERAQLAPLATALDELTQRITVLAESFAGDNDDQLSTELFEIERSLQQAARRLERVIRRH